MLMPVATVEEGQAIIREHEGKQRTQRDEKDTTAQEG
jgi:hypothetical protein